MASTENKDENLNEKKKETEKKVKSLSFSYPFTMACVYLKHRFLERRIFLKKKTIFLYKGVCSQYPAVCPFTKYGCHGLVICDDTCARQGLVVECGTVAMSTVPEYTNTLKPGFCF